VPTSPPLLPPPTRPQQPSSRVSCVTWLACASHAPRGALTTRFSTGCIPMSCPCCRRCSFPGSFICPLQRMTRAQCLTLWGGPQHVSTAHAIFKLLCELSHNKSQRIQVFFLHPLASSMNPADQLDPSPVRRVFAQRHPAVQGGRAVRDAGLHLQIAASSHPVTLSRFSCVCTYAQQLSTYALPPGSPDAWKIRFKGVMHVLTCLTRAYSGM
jgi:hypothetical protein